MAGRELRRALTISDPKPAVVDPSNPLKPHDDNADADEIRRSLRRASNGGGDGAGAASAGRTLMDIIREEQEMSESGSGSGSIRTNGNGTINWKSFKDRIRLRRAGGVWSDATDPPSNPVNPVPVSANPIPSSSTGTGTELQQQAQQPVRISLMALLEQTSEAGAGDDEDEDEDEDEEAEDEDGEDGGLYHACCVCMVRHKGAAFIPCGHTFCRLCSRELWVSRGNCPLCNGFILEILDIF